MSRNIWLIAIHIHQECLCNTLLRSLLEGREVALDTHCSVDLQQEGKEAVSQGCSAACPKHCTVILLQKQALQSLKRKRIWLQREKG